MKIECGKYHSGNHRLMQFGGRGSAYQCQGCGAMYTAEQVHDAEQAGRETVADGGEGWKRRANR